MLSSLRSTLALAGVALSACSSASTTETTGFTASPLVTTTSTGGSLLVDVRTSPQPPVEGMNEARVTLTDSASGAPVDGLTMAVVPWMPAMGHGTSLVPTVKALGDGVYEVDQLSLFMGGEWELRLTLDGPMHDTANPAFNVP